MNKGFFNIVKWIFIASTILFYFSCQREKTDEAPALSSGNIKDSIESIYANTNFEDNIYENDHRWAIYKNHMNANPSDVNAIFKYSIESLNSGRTEEAIRGIKKIQEMNPLMKEVNQQTLMLHKFLGISYLRMAEQQNCIHNHNDESCIVPIKGGGIHLDRSWSEKAIEKYEEILKVVPEDYESRWLLNLAYMTIDAYPEAVPDEYLIQIPEQDQIESWENIATRTGVDHNGLSGGVILDDFNNDHLLDIMASSWGFDGELIYYENNGKTGYEDKTKIAGLLDVTGGLNLKQADYNNDGNLDFLIMRGAWKSGSSWGIPPNSLMRNNGNGTFTDVTLESGMYSTRPTQSAEWFDYNNDGWLDLFVANETTQKSTEKFSCELYKNNGDGTFTEIAQEAGVNFTGYFKGVNSGDINNDGWPDLYLTTLGGPNKLLVNQYHVTPNTPFTDIASDAGVIYPFAAFPVWMWDVNQDGYEDIYVATFDTNAFKDQAGQFARDLLGLPISTEPNKLYINNGNMEFSDATEEYFDYQALSTMGSNFGDVNNDGYPDFYLGTGAPDYRAVVPNRFFINLSGKKFSDQTFAMGSGHIQKGHGVGFGDLDNDGDQDLYTVMGGAFSADLFPNALFFNPGTANNWIKIKLEGTSVNRSAIGARVRVIRENPSDTLYHRVNSGGSFGANPLMSHIGLGEYADNIRVEVDWPDNTINFTSYGFLIPNKLYHIKQGKSPVEIPLRKIDFEDKKLEHYHHHN